MKVSSMQRYLFAIVISCGLITGCQKATGPRASEEIDFGTIENSVYKNKYFGLSLTFPEGWSVLDQQQRDELKDLGSEIVAGDDKNLNKAMKSAAELQTVNMLSVFEHPLGTDVPYNPNIIIMAERVRHAPGIKRGNDYHVHTKKVLESSNQLSVNFGETFTEMIGGKEFDVQPLQMGIGNQVVKQKMYATIDKGYALLLVISYDAPEEEEKLQAILKTITFSAVE